MIINTLFVVVVIIFIIFIILGICRGLFKSVFKLIAGLLAILLAYIVAPIIGEIIINYTTIDDKIRDAVYVRIEREVEQKVRQQVNQQIENSMGIDASLVDPSIINAAVDAAMNSELNRNQQIEMIREIKAPEFIKNALIENNHDDVRNTLGVSGFYDYVATYISRMAVNAMAFILSYLILTVLLMIIAAVLARLVSLPIVGTINRIGGMALGFCEALILVWILFFIISLGTVTSLGQQLYGQILENTILIKLYNANIFTNIVNGIIKIKF